MRWPLGILTVTVLGLLLLIDVSGDFPLNDDWQYAYGVQSLLETGQLAYRGVFSPIVLTQVGWAACFCTLTEGAFSFDCLRWSTLALLPLGLWGVLYLGRGIGLSDRQLWVVGLVFVSCPLVLVLAASFMSDVPFAVLATAATVAYWRFHETAAWRYLWLSLLAATLAFYERQPGMILPVAFGMHYAWQSGRKSDWLITVAGAAYGLFLLLSWELVVKPELGLGPHMKSDMYRYLGELRTQPLLFTKSLLLRQLKNGVYLGLFSLPLIPWLRIRLRRREWALISLLSLGFVLLAHLADKPFPFGGNIFYNWGLGPELLVDTYTLGLTHHTPQMPQWLMDVLHFLATAAALTLIRTLYLRWTALSKPAKSYWRLWLIVALCYFPLMAITSYYDRYVLWPLWLLWPALLTLVPAQTPVVQTNDTRRHFLSQFLAYLVLVSYLFFTVAATHDYFAWNRARWQALQQLTAQGITIDQMDAGYELNGWYNYGAPRYQDKDHSFWWVTNDTYLLTFGPVAGYHEIDRVPFRRWLWLKTDFIHVLRKDMP
ncbi:MAG: hypothetical protein D6772_01735 [Bacteroidetes bacterium]|nr:MAG: hypothetical protein D6772_01735 [Bacteroidota bacterium]